MADTALPPLPEGFTLDAPVQAAPVDLPPLPEGFKLDPAWDPKYRSEVEANAVKTAPADQGSYIKEIGKGAAQGAVDTVASAVKGAAVPPKPVTDMVANDAKLFETMKTMTPSLKTMSPDRYQLWKDLASGIKTASAREAAMKMLEIGDAVRSGKATEDALAGITFQRADGVFDATKEPAFKAGEQIQEWSKKTFEAAPGWEDSWTRSIASGLGSTVPFLLTAPLGPTAGLLAGGALGQASTSGQAIDTAQKANATPAQITEAAQKAAPIGATEMLPIEIILQRVPVAARTALTRAIKKIGVQAATEGLQEGGTQFLQNLVEKTTYNPEKDLWDGVPQSAGMGALIGGIMEAPVSTVEAVRGDKPAAAPTQEPNSVEPVTSPDAAPDVTGEGVNSPLASSPVDPSGRAMLRQAGFDDELIDGMGSEEFDGYIQEAVKAGIKVSDDELADAAKYEQARRPVPVDAQNPAPVSQSVQTENAAVRTATGQETASQIPNSTGIAPVDVVAMRRAGEQQAAMPVEDVAQPVQPRPVNNGNLPISDLVALNKATKQSIAEDQATARPIPPAPDVRPSRYAGMTPTQILEKSGRRVPLQGTRQGPVDPALPIRDLTDLVRIARDGVRSDMAMAERKRLRDQIIGEGKMLSPDVRRDLMRTVRDSLAGDVELAARIENEANTLFQATPKAAAQEPAPVKPTKKPMNLMRFLAKSGGLKDSGGELRAMDLHKKFIPGSGKLVRSNGRTLDDATRLAVENGYLPQGSTIADFLNAVDRDNRGGDVFSTEQATDAINWKSEEELAARGGKDLVPERKQQVDPDNPFGLTDENIDEFDATYQRVIDAGFSQDIADDVLKAMTGMYGFRSGMTFDAALDTVVEIHAREQYDIVDPGHEDLPFWDEINKDKADVENAGKSSEAGRDGGTQSAEPAGRPESGPDGSRQEPASDGEVQAERSNEDSGSGNRKSAAVSQPEAVSEEASPSPAAARTEPGADGKPQMVITGAERASDRDMAQRKADAPMKPKVQQKDAGGLFSDDANQMDLVDLSRQKPKDDMKLEQPSPERFREVADGWVNAGDKGFQSQDMSDPKAGTSLFSHARDVILERGKTTGHEYLAAFNKDGKLIEYGTSGREGNVSFPNFLINAALSPLRQIVLYHNHPNNRSFSVQDIGLLGAPGIHSVWAFGHAGRNDRARLSKALADRFKRIKTPDMERMAFMQRLAERANRYTGERFAKLVAEGKIPRSAADAAWVVAPTEVMRRAGFIEYDTNQGYDFTSIEGFDEAINDVAKTLSKEIFNGSEANYQPDRSAVDYGHDAEVDGASWVLSEPSEDRFDAKLGDKRSAARDTAEKATGRGREDRQVEVVRDERGRFAKDPFSLAEEVSRAPVPDDTDPRDVPKVAMGARLKNALARAEKATVKGVKSHGNLDRRSIKDSETIGELAKRKLVDYLDPVLRMQEKTGVKLNDMLNVYQTARLVEGTSRDEIKQISDKYVGPMAEALARVGGTIEDVHKYMWAKHAPERNKVVGERNPEDSALFAAATDENIKGASGLSTKQAREMIAEMRKDKARFDGIVEAAGYIRQMLDASLQHNVRAGLISKASYDELKAQWKDYVPLKPEELMNEDTGYMPGMTSGFDVRGKEFKGATGLFSDAENVVVHAVTQAERTVIRKEKNRVGQTFLRLINTHDPEGKWLGEVYWSKDTDAGDMDITKAKDVWKREIGKDGKVVERKVQNPFSRRDDVIATKLGGKVYYIKPADPKVGLALRKLTLEQITGASKIVGKFTNLQSMVNTRFNPAFTPINIIRDVGTGAVFLKDEGFSAKEVTKTIGTIPSAWKALWTYARTGETPNTEWGRHLSDFLKAGGKINFDQFTTIEDQMNRLQKEINAASRGPVKGSIANAFKLLEDINDTAENGFRLAVYVAARGKGVTDKSAAFLARDLTVDFQKRGEYSSEMSRWYVFFNAAVQGNYNVAKRLAKSKVVRRAAMGMITAGFLQHFWNMWAAGDDDDGESVYEKMLRDESFKLERQVLLFIPGTKQYVSFPLPFGLNAFWHMGTQAGAMTTGQQSIGAGLLDSAKVAVDAFNPLGSGSFWTIVSPTIMDPAVELWNNENFFGAQIYPEKNPFDKSPDPDSQVSFPRTSPIFKWIAEGLNGIDGNDVEPGSVDIHPDTLEYLWGFFTGGVGRFFGQSVETGARAMDGQFEPPKTPWVRSFYGEFAESSRKNEYYSQRARVQDVAGRYDEYRSQRRVEELEDFKRRYPHEVAGIPIYKRAETQRREINKMRRKIEASDLPMAEKTKRLDALAKRDEDIMNRARKAYYEAGKDL